MSPRRLTVTLTCVALLGGCGSTGPTVRYESRIGAEADVAPASSFVVEVAAAEAHLSEGRQRAVDQHRASLEEALAKRGLTRAASRESADVVIATTLSFASGTDDCSNVFGSESWFPSCPTGKKVDVTIVAGTALAALVVVRRDGTVVIATEVRRTRSETIANDSSLWTAIGNSTLLGDSSKQVELIEAAAEALTPAIVDLLTPSCESVKTALMTGSAKQFDAASAAARRGDWAAVQGALAAVSSKEPSEVYAVAYNLGVAYEAMGQMALALEQFDLCHAVATEHPPFFTSGPGQSSSSGAIEASDPRIKCNLAKVRVASRIERAGWFERNGVGEYKCP